MFRSEWNEAYKRGENHLFEPNEELVKFLARYVFHSRDASTGQPIISTSYVSDAKDKLTVLDIGCGIGAQSEYLARLGFRVIGCDISDIAIQAASARTRSNGSDVTYYTIDPRYVPSISCDIAIACASLDSMPYECAYNWLHMLQSVMSRDVGLLFATFISARNDGFTGEEIISEDHERGTTQNYFDQEKITELLASSGFEVARLDLVSHHNIIPGISIRSPGRYSVVAKISN